VPTEGEGGDRGVRDELSRVHLATFVRIPDSDHLVRRPRGEPPVGEYHEHGHPVPRGLSVGA
jgi:hypothetical protein